jgi:hypothetical protein
VIAEPPVVAGAVQFTVAWPLPGVALTFVGADGAVGAVGAVGMTAFDTLLGGPAATAFVATTVNVYDVPFVRPVTVHWVGPPLVEHVCEPELDVTV